MVYRIARVFVFVSFPKDVRIYLGFQILRFFCVWKAFSTDGTLMYLRYRRERERERERERKKRQFAFARFEKRERAAPFVRREYILVKCKNQSCYSGKIISKITKRRKKK